MRARAGIQPYRHKQYKAEFDCLGCGRRSSQQFINSKQCCSRECWNKYRQDKQSYLANHIGMSQESFSAMVASQSNVCALCGHPEPSHSRFTYLSIDHSHSCPNHGINKSCPACRRGLLCSPCNKALGMVEDVLLFNISKSIDSNELSDYRQKQLAYLKKYL